MTASINLTRTVPPGGIRGYQNTTGTMIPRHTVVVRDSGDPRAVKLPSAVTDDVVGVTMVDMPSDDGVFYDVQIRGRAICRAHGALGDAVRVMPTTSGRVDTWAAAGGSNAAVVGETEGTASAQDDPIVVELAGPSVARQG